MPNPTAQIGVTRWRQSASALLNLRPGDGWPLAILLAHSFLKGAARVLLETPANTFFLGRFAIDRLPQVYMATAVVCLTIGLAYARLEARVSVKSLLTATLAFLSVVTLIFYVALAREQSGSAIFGLMVWKDVHWTLMSLEFWALAGMLLDVRQGKRLFGMIALGEIVAGMIGGFSVPALIASGGAMLLLLASAAITVANVFLLLYTMRQFAGRRTAASEEPSGDRRPLVSLFKDHYLLLFFGVSVLSFFGEYFIDYLFYENVERRFPDEATLATFFGMFYGVLSVGQLLSSAWISGRYLTRYGLSFGLLAAPVATIATIGVASVGGLLPAAVIVLFWAVVSAKFFDETIRQTIEMPAYRILYQPLPPHERLRVQAVRESIVEPMSIGLVGLALWEIQSVMALAPRDVLHLTLVVALAWAGLCILLRREYTVRLTRALTTRRLGGGALTLGDRSSISVLEQGFRSPKAGQVIYCLDRVEESRHPSLEANLVKLLDHADPLVRDHVLGKIERLGIRSTGPLIAQRLETETSPCVRAAILRTLCALHEADVLDRIIPYLTDPEIIVRRGALVGLLRHCGLDGVLAGGSQLSQLLSSSMPADRQLAAEVLGDIGIASFYRPLVGLLRDENIAVRLAALEAARKLRAMGAIRAMLDALAVRALRGAASAAMVDLGEIAIAPLEQAFADEHLGRESRKAIVQICGRIGGDKATTFLIRHMDHPDIAVRTKVLSSLVQCRERAGWPEIPSARASIVREAEQATWAFAAWADIEGDSAHAELSRALLGEIDDRKHRIFLLLSLIYPPVVIRKARLDLEAGGAEKKAHALEVFDNLLSQELKKHVFPLIDQLSPHQRGKQLQVLFPQTPLAHAARLREMLERGPGQTGAWVRACALYVVGTTRASEFSALAADRLGDLDAMVRETAGWTLSRVNPAAAADIAAICDNDSSPVAKRLDSHFSAEDISDVSHG